MACVMLIANVYLFLGIIEACDFEIHSFVGPHEYLSRSTLETKKVKLSKAS